MPTPPDSKPFDVSLIQAPSIPLPNDDPEAKAEQADYIRDRHALELQDFENEIKARRSFADKLFIFMIAWMVIMVLLVVANAISIPCVQRYVSFHLSDSVLITLVTTTTGTVVGVFLIVAKFLYRAREK